MPFFRNRRYVRREIDIFGDELTSFRQRCKPKKALINCLYGRIAALRGARNLDIFLYMPRFLRSVRLALHPAQTINQCFPNVSRIVKFNMKWRRGHRHARVRSATSC